jgi:hypothetical protein
MFNISCSLKPQTLRLNKEIIRFKNDFSFRKCFYFKNKLILTLTEVKIDPCRIYIEVKPAEESIHDLLPYINQIGILLSTLSMRFIMGFFA